MYCVVLRQSIKAAGQYHNVNIHLNLSCKLMEQDNGCSVHSLIKNALFTKSPEKVENVNFSV